MLKLKSTIFFVPILFFLIIIGSCNNDTNVSTTSDNNVSVGYYAENPQGDNTIIIDEAKFIVRKVVLKGEDGDHHEGDHDVKLGPFVVVLDLTQKVVVAAVAQIPLGNYHEIKFQIHKLNPNEVVPDPEFVESNSQRFSVIVKGSFNGVPFVYKSAISVDREIEFEHVPVQISESAFINITIRLNVFSWFDSNGTLLDPNNPANSNNIDHNIKNSFKRAFRDLNKDGDPD